MTFIVINVVGEAADEAEEEALTSCQGALCCQWESAAAFTPWADAAAGSRGEGGGGGRRDAEGTTLGCWTTTPQLNFGGKNE